MEHHLNQIRMSLLYHEYGKQHVQEEDWPHIRFQAANDMPGIRTYLDILALAVLFEYVSIDLNPEMSWQLHDLASSKEYKSFRWRSHPLLRFLIKLHLNKTEIHSRVEKHPLYFEELIILDQEFNTNEDFSQLRAHMSFGGVIPEPLIDLFEQTLPDPDPEKFLALLIQFPFLQEYLGFLELMNFCKSLYYLLKKIDNELLTSAVCHYYSPILKDFNNRKYIELYYHLSSLIKAFSGIHYRHLIVDAEENKFDLYYNYLNKLESSQQAFDHYFLWLTDDKRKFAFTTFLEQNESEIFAIAGIEDFDPENRYIDLDHLRALLRNAEWS